MIEKIGNFLASDKRRAAKVVLALAVALIIVAAAAVLSAVDLGGLFEDPYPSEDTPLTLSVDSVIWTGQYNISFDLAGGGYSVSDVLPLEGIGANYSLMRFLWGDGSGWLGGAVASESDQLLLSAGSRATVESEVSVFNPGLAGEIVYSLVITDVLGDGAFGYGDQIAFKESPATTWIAEDTVGTVALVYIGEHRTYTGFGEYSFALHDRDFYSWGSHELNWEEPWYDF